MNFRQFAFNNVMRSKRAYAAHFLSSTFSIMIFFTYALLLFHPNLQGELASGSKTMAVLGTVGMQISQSLIFLFSFFFLLYSVSSFLKTRKKEFGILMMHGMSPSQLNTLIFLENMVIGAAAILFGILMGLIFSKLILLLSANLLAVENGLPFYIPIKAIGTTAGAFLILFLFISLFTSKMVKINQLIELMKSEEKPKPEPKASWIRALFSLLFIGAGYGCVFDFVKTLTIGFYPLLLVLGVACTVIGTYYLFSQLSVYVLGRLKKNERLFFKKTNLLTISELAYRMKDNATMFFMLAVISAVSFTGIGTCLSMGNSALITMQQPPFAFIYDSRGENAQEEEHIEEIKRQLTKAGMSYRVGNVTPKLSEIDVTNPKSTRHTIIKLSEYNSLAKALGYQTEMLQNENETILVPGTNSERDKYQKRVGIPSEIDVLQGDTDRSFKVKKAVPYLVVPNREGVTLVVSDSMYDAIPSRNVLPTTKHYGFFVEDWTETKDVANQLNAKFTEKEQKDPKYTFQSLYTDSHMFKQANGILLITSLLVGIVFFTFAASLLYFRLYADLERDQKQYEMIAKVGLSKKELKQIVTRQLTLMFFLPILVAVIHSSVAFLALQQLLKFSIWNTSILVLVGFIGIQILYFFMVRREYLRQLYSKILYM
ncbi:ABC transporter permease [Bacillus thuringiensis]|uniref:FtsX-like permease family protein n=1 Tax=Bacillus cereus group TaxID=86661 RepID=UPI000BF33B97|nr:MULTISPECIES: ABC transporter permease [Bacillus cereus group]PEV57425.1 ABC transporter permease [Bacillus cereus]PFO23175.1 ABC transporter permease [Bacillus thuringiensis]